MLPHFGALERNVTPKHPRKSYKAAYPRMHQLRPSKLPERRVFTLFPDLPFELRFVIFECALPPPRFVELKVADPHNIQSRQYSEAAIPALLHASTESRQVMQLLGYQLAFVTDSRVNWGYGNMQQYLELDYADVANEMSSEYEAAEKYHPSILRYMEQYDSNGKSFFVHRADEFQEELSAAQVSATYCGHSGWNIPDMKLVRLAGSNDAEHIMWQRDMYWDRIKALEKAMNKRWLKPWDPFTSYYADDIEALEEVYREERELGMRKVLGNDAKGHKGTESLPSPCASDESNARSMIHQQQSFEDCGERKLTARRFKQRC
ncbi:hypothetical protein DL98DRAFT_565217 [Cadophora sp. DSE1049]|nr:hypothetical protein DL98DRAFT_565217 [Cadophora sp. DSE1049]